MARVLLVEDDAVTAMHFRQLLTAAGHAVTICAEGSEAIVQCRQTPPELIITDYRMPGVDGAGLIAWVRGSVDADLPIILITGAQRGELPPAIGSDLLLSKPFHEEDLLRTVEIIVARRARQQAGENISAGIAR
jgi:CheY-like chemotaxis protein